MTSPLFDSPKKIIDDISQDISQRGEAESRPDERDGQMVADDRELEEGYEEDFEDEDFDESLDKTIIEEIYWGNKEGVHSVVYSAERKMIVSCSEFGLATNKILKKKKGKGEKKREEEEDEEGEEEQFKSLSSVGRNFVDLGVDYGCANHMILWDEDTIFISTEEGDIQKYSLKKQEFSDEPIYFDDWAHEILQMLKITDNILCCITPQDINEGLAIMSISENSLLTVSRQAVSHSSKIKLSKKYPNSIYLKTSEKENFMIKILRLNNIQEDKENVEIVIQRKFDFHDEDVFDFDVYISESKRGKEILVCGGEGQTIYFYDTTTGECFHRLETSTSIFSLCLVSGFSRTFMFTGHSHDLSLYVLEDENNNFVIEKIFEKKVIGKKVKRYKDRRKHLYGAKEGVLEIQKFNPFFPRGENLIRLLIGCEDRTVKIVRLDRKMLFKVDGEEKEKEKKKEESDEEEEEESDEEESDEEEEEEEEGEGESD